MNRMHVLVVGLLSVSLAACSGTAAASGAGSGSKLNASYADALPPASQLVVGTLKLNGTPQAVDAAQAATLLPLWQAYQSLLRNSSTAAPAEFEGLERQIEQAMTPAQLDAIAKMHLTNKDTSSVFSLLGQGSANGGTPFPRNNNGSTGGTGNRTGGGNGFFGGGGGFFGGGGVPGGFSGQGGAPSTPNAQLRATVQAQATAQQAVAGVNIRLVSIMIRYLQQILGPTPTASGSPAAASTPVPTATATATPAA